jgi:hypothetical protein
MIARGRMEDWKQMRDIATQRADVRERILRVCAPHLSDPYDQQYYFWAYYVRNLLA